MDQDIGYQIMHEFKKNQSLLIAIGNETRQAILITLAQGAGMRVGEISTNTHLSRPAISHHLKILKDAGIVTVHKDGTKNFYRIDAKNKMQSLRDLVDDVIKLCE
ncbi:ArsR/SmtB family transcription factor [Paenibacillus paridis]|uniref:ArsR/SmtB family transcription factor n=1 Tax=Paenibacillus paridis TaxID=2583376 RepID=UPI001124C3AC|nr:metalloregulator ArsR/SmtB family transcription factor [Paenibacillus paridis]